MTIDKYGNTPMTFEEEIELWNEHKYQAITRSNKRIIINALECLHEEANQLMEQIKFIPAEDDVNHAFRVQCLADDIAKIKDELDRVYWKNAGATIEELKKNHKNPQFPY